MTWAEPEAPLHSSSRSLGPYCLTLNTGVTFVVFNEARPRERNDRGRVLLIGKRASSYRGAYRVQLAKLSFNHSTVVLTADVFQFFIKFEN